MPERMPKSLLVIGSGAIGIEFASFYRTLGAEVTVVEVLPQILPVEDAEIAAFARKSFEKQGIKIFTGAKVTKLDKKADSVTATIDDGKGGTQTLTVERVISAVGVVGNIENLGLEKLGVKTERGAIVIDGACKTNVPGIYAIGDVAGPPMLAHKAEHEGVICVEAIKGLHPHPMDKRLIPGCTYCTPQIASVGLTEQAAKEQEARHPRRPLSLRRQRQGDRARRGSGPGQGDLRQEDRPASRRAHGRRRGHRADPGLRGGDESRDHGRRADAHRLPASDPVGDDEGSGARCLRARAEYLIRHSGLPRSGASRKSIFVVVMRSRVRGLRPRPGMTPARKMASLIYNFHPSRRGVMAKFDSILGTIGRTPVVRINKLAPDGVNLYVKIEAFNPLGSVKDRLALGVIEAAEKSGQLKPGQTVIEATSGNTGIGLAMVCAAKGYPLVVTMAESFSASSAAS